MSSRERLNGSGLGSGSVVTEIGAESYLPGVIAIPVSSLKPRKDGGGINLLDALPAIKKAILGSKEKKEGEEKEEGKKWYPKLLRDVKQGKKKAVVVAALGTLMIFVAGAGIELGLRHGQDLREFDKLLRRGKKK